jgi:hypothetical protein
VCASLGRVETQVRVPLSASIALSVGCTFAVAALWMLLRQPSESLPGQSSTF